ncbi:hypothetical protein [Mycolicibacterium goodii]|uniref:DUF2613 domain-containing protein n=1 Tax=Mycolicibacterium goodii TaxID=134601 RepID=A0ABS6HVW0_MYCGD|nr:hypothetical protein [Mycolicibacterium goodii]OKH63049.1 hypothetical protein EB74_14050 [Mycobacterium sp. SWH-M5]MBU8808029.1 hypothetical protein [Mycolicibacterium goodii]MBU8820122.1 hypothetical protein [Mycolicibacterium goodii]MBU8826798.1 hypothetical protein [Mycolicibacterium goodii]MBU8829725.1 hypothetical protein [Mycolicibacterium goodii]
MAEVKKITRFTTGAALLGGAAAVAMGIIGASMGGSADQPAVASGGAMKVGETTTVTYTPGTIAPVVAKPEVKAPPYGAN